MVMTLAGTVEQLGQVMGIRGEARTHHGWLEYVVRRRVKRSLAKARRKREAGAFADGAPEEHARRVVRWACAKAAVTGALSGAASTGAVVTTVETEGIAGVVVVPLAIGAIGVEMATRAVFHVDLACELAEIFEVPVESADDVARLLSIGMRPTDEAEGEDLGKTLVQRATVDRDELLERAASLLVGESVLRNLLPFVGIVSSAATNYLVTRRLGRRLRRSFRYERAMLEVLAEAKETCASCMDTLVEGLWFLFTADGKLSSEEAACLSERLDDLDEQTRRTVLARFTMDESEWLKRLGSVPPEARRSFLRFLEVAAALDKSIALPEEKLLSRVAQVLGCPYDSERLQRLVAQLTRTGVLA